MGHEEGVKWGMGTVVLGHPLICIFSWKNVLFSRVSAKNQGGPKTAAPTTTHTIPHLMPSKVVETLSVQVPTKWQSTDDGPTLQRTQCCSVARTCLSALDCAIQALHLGASVTHETGSSVSLQCGTIVCCICVASLATPKTLRFSQLKTQTFCTGILSFPYEKITAIVLWLFDRHFLRFVASELAMLHMALWKHTFLFLCLVF